MKRMIVMFFLSGAALLCAISGNIPLKGDLQGGGTVKNPTLTPLIEAYQNAGSIEITFLNDLGKLQIVVCDQNDEEAYAMGVDTSVVSSLPISTDGWSAGTYTLMITDGQGGYLIGYFVID